MFMTVVGALNEGFVQTLALFAVTLAGALPLGLIVSFGSMSRFTPLRWLTRTVIWVIRGTPLMLQLYIIFFIPGMVLPSGNPWPAGTAGRFIAAAVARHSDSVRYVYGNYYRWALFQKARLRPVRHNDLRSRCNSVGRARRARLRLHLSVEQHIHARLVNVFRFSQRRLGHLRRRNLGLSCRYGNG